MRAKLVALIVFTLLVSCGGSSEGESADTPAASSEPETTIIVGSVLAPIDILALWDEGMKMSDDETYERGVTPCRADRDSAPGVKQGTQIVVRDAEGTTVGVDELSEGVLGGKGRTAPMDAPCEFSFDIRGVPGGESFYSFQVGTENEVTLSADEVEGRVELRLP